MATQEIDKIASETSEERGRGSDEASPAARRQENIAKLLHKYRPMLFPLATITCIILKEVFGSEGIVGFKSTLVKGLEDISGFSILIGLDLVGLFCVTYTYADIEAYSMTVAVVVTDYNLLVTINKKYMCMEIAIIPVIILFFIRALARKVRGNQSLSQCDQRREPMESGEELIKMAMVPYLFQLSLVIWTQCRGQEDIIFIFSDFLLFFSSVLCALAVMIRLPPIGVSAGSEQVLPVMQKTCIIMLMVTAQTMTAEWLGEDIIFVCMLELMAVLSWLGTRIHHAGLVVSMICAMSGRSSRYFLSSVVVVLALLLSAYPNGDSISRASWLARLFCISSSCSALSHFHVWLLHQWPGSRTPNSNGSVLIQLLNFFSTISFRTSGILFSAMMMISMFISTDPWIFLHEATRWVPAASLLLVPLIFSTEQHREEHDKSTGKKEPSSDVVLPQLPAELSAVQHRGDPDKTIKEIEPAASDMVLLAMQHKYYNGIGVGALPHLISLLNSKLDKLLEGAALSQEIDGAISKLRDHFESMRKPLNNRNIQIETQNDNWVGRVLDLVYDMDNWVDLLAQGVDERRRIVELENLQRRTEDVSLQLFSQLTPSTTEDVSTSTASLDDPPLTADSSSSSSSSSQLLVGMDSPRDNILVSSASSDHGLRVLCIVGMVGSGKTTLAREVYKHISDKFDCRAWVSMGGQTQDKAKVLKHLLSEFGRIGNVDDVDQLSRRLKNHLYDKRYLIIIDDLSSTDNTWGAIRRCLPENNRGSMIIMTTRYQYVASISGHVIHKTLLDDTDARKLLYQRTFGDSVNCPEDLKDVSDKILRKCGGLPLALVSVGNMLANMPRTQEAFESFLEPGAFYRPGLQGQASFQAKTMRRIIGHTYNDLHAVARTCLLYLSIFPDEYAIDINHLVKLLIAEGFIGDGGYVSAENSAKNYINELSVEKMIQYKQLDVNDGVNRKIRVVHPVIHDFIVWQAMEENFVTIAQAGNNCNRGRTVRRLSIFDEVEEEIDLSHACSVIVFGHAPPLTKLSVVRVLDLENCKGPICLDGLCKLVLLRYLNLRGTNVSDLPKNIGDLRSLEILDVRSTMVKELPPSIVKLKNLFRLLAGNAKLPNGIGKMKALQILSCAVVGNSSASVLEKVSQIHSLRDLELFCDQVSGDEKQVAFPTGGFWDLERLRIQSSFPFLTFQKNEGLRRVTVLELNLQSMETPVVSGLEYLPRVKSVLVDQDSGPEALDAVRDAVKFRTRPSEVRQVRWEEFY